MAAFSSRRLLYYIGVHHKTGTVWMKHLHEAIGDRLGLPMIELVRPPASSASGPGAVDPAVLESTLEPIRGLRRGIVLDQHSVYTEIPRQIPRMRGVHVVRDPRDVLISATFYHLKSSERWLRRPMARFDGMTYQEKLSAARTVREALVFELGHQTQLAIAEMAAFPKLSTVPTITYESLMGGEVLSAFEAMFKALGFSGRARRVALECAQRESILLNPARRESSHVRSGETRQWRRVFDRALGERFAAAAGPALVTLGYEPDDAWVGDLPAARPTLDRPLQDGQADMARTDSPAVG